VSGITEQGQRARGPTAKSLYGRKRKRDQQCELQGFFVATVNRVVSCGMSVATAMVAMWVIVIVWAMRSVHGQSGTLCRMVTNLNPAP